MSKTKQQNNNQRVNIVLPSDMSAEQMKEVIADAILLAEEKKTLRTQAEIEKQKDNELREWQQYIGYKDKDGKKHSILCALVRLNFGKREKIKGDRVLLFLNRFVLGLIFGLLQILCLLMPFVILLFSGKIYSELGLFNTILLVFASAFIGLEFGGFFRLACIEIDNIDDKNYLFTISSNTIAIITLAIAVITLIVTV